MGPPPQPPAPGVLPGVSKEDAPSPQAPPPPPQGSQFCAATLADVFRQPLLYTQTSPCSHYLLPKQLKSFRSWLESAEEAGGGGRCWGRGWRETKPSSSLETVCSLDGLLKILFMLQVQKGKRGDSWVGEMLLVDSCVQEGSGAGSGVCGVGGRTYCALQTLRAAAAEPGSEAALIVLHSRLHSRLPLTTLPL